MSEHRSYFMDHALLYLFSADIEFAMNIEELGLVPGGLRLNLACVPGVSRIYNVLRERTVGFPGYPTVSGTVTWAEDPVVVSELDVAIADVRGTIQTDDGARIDMEYYGIMPMGRGAYRSVAGGADPLGTEDEPAEYRLVVAPTYSTESKAYRWLTEEQCVAFGRVQQIGGLFRRVSYDIYAMT